MAPNYLVNSDLGKLTLSELWRLTRSPLTWLILVFKFKIFRGATTYTMAFGDQYLSPERWGDLSTIQEPLRDKLAPAAGEALQAGVCPAIYSEVDAIGAIRLGIALQRSSDGRAYLSHIANTNWESGQPVDSLTAGCVTPLSDGTFLVSSNNRMELNPTPRFRLARRVGVTPTELVDFHRQRLSDWTESQPRLLQSDAEMILAQIEVERIERDHMIERGFSRHLTDEEVAELRSLYETTGSREAVSASGIGEAVCGTEMEADGMTEEDLEQDYVTGEESSRYGAILKAIEQANQTKSSWASNLILLVLSIIGFVAAGFADLGWESLLGLVFVIFVHEAGHYIAMALFGYRNVRMFFIPFFGAAVSGQNYNVAGWKKSIVSLAGPVPGIVIGSILLAQPWWSQEWLKSLALWFVGLNVFNLLPILPLDGGWIVHAVISSRNRYLELAARIIGPTAMIVIGVLVNSFVLIGLGALMLKAVPLLFRLAGVTTRLREEGIQAEASDDEIPTSTAIRIIDEIEEVAPNQPPSELSTHTINVFEALNAKPPGVLASLAILSTHVAAMVLPFFAMVIAGLLGGPNLNFTPESPVVSVSARQPIEVDASDLYEPSEDSTLLMIVKSDNAEAAQAMEDVRGLVEDGDAAKRFDKLVFFDASDPLEAKTVRGQLESMGHVVNTFRPIGPNVTITIGEATERNLAAREQLRGYLMIPPGCQLIPPWHAKQTIDAEPAERRKHVATLVPFVGRIPASADSLAIYEEVKKLSRLESPDFEEIRKLQKEADNLRRQNVISATIKANQEGSLQHIAPQLVKAYLDKISPGPEDSSLSDEEFQQWELEWKRGIAEFGVALGQLPLEDMDASYEDRCYGCSGMIWKDEEDGLVRMDLQFIDPSVALPHLIRWLEEQGCEDLQLKVERQIEFPDFGGMFGDE